MAENTPETISPEAFERIKRERDEAKAKADEYAAAVRDAGAKEIATDYFRAKGHSDPVAAASSVLPYIRDAGDPDAMRTALDGLSGAFTAPAPPSGGDQPPATSDPAPTTERPQAPAAPVPSPGNPGQGLNVQPEVVDFRSPKVREALARGDEAGLRDLVTAGGMRQTYVDPLSKGATPS